MPIFGAIISSSLLLNCSQDAGDGGGTSRAGTSASGGDAGASAQVAGGSAGVPQAGGADAAGAAGASAAGSGAGGSAGTTSQAGGGAGGTAGSGAVFEPSFILGADISSVQEAVEGGASYVDTDGMTKDMLSLLKNHGFNYVRLRTFVDPSAAYGYASGSNGCQARAEAYCDKAHTIEFAQQVKSAGMGLLLDFHYSDTWADPGKQIIPAAWRDAASIDALAASLKAYTKDVVQALVDAGARPDMVQVGNEITPGMLIHTPTVDTDCWGNDSSPSSLTGSSSNWDNLSALLKAGSEGVREIDANIKIMLHIESTDELSVTSWWVENALSHGVSFDVLGLSCYTEYQGQPDVWENTFATLAADFPELSFAIAEYNPERTAANQIMKDLPDGRGLGTFFWEPTQSGAWGESMFTWSDGAYEANQDDFAEFDALTQSLGL